ncbi:MAG: hypothetical protein JXA45_04390 [Methanomassiliicoccales archaeon]|nr:hypothetical protein [Methanomassiliicoccales archaeon]
MTPRERFEGALKSEAVDHPPIMYQHLGAANSILGATGLSIRQGMEDPEAFARIAIAAQRVTGFDNVMAGWGDLLVEAHAHGTSWRWPERDYYPRVERYAIASLSELDRVRPVDPLKDEGWSVPLRAAGLMQESVGKELPVLGCITGPMMMAGEVMGYESLLIATWTDPDLVQGLMDVMVQSSAAYGERLAQMGVGHVFIEDGSCGLDTNSVEGLERFDLGNLSKVLSSFTSQGLGSIVHNCSSDPYLDGYLAMRPVALHFTPRREDRASSYEKFRGRTTVIGGIDHMFLLFQGTPEEVVMEVDAMHGDWGEGAGFMIAPGCEMPFKTPLGNIVALREAVQGWKA